jgi:hypothetical protein
VDLIEMAVAAGRTVTIAHDPRVPAPAWLTSQFEAVGGSVLVNGQPMRLHARRIDADQSLTLGSNTDGTPGIANMYVVFVTQQ